MIKEDTLIFAQITDTHIVPINKKWVNIESKVMSARLRKVVQEINTFNPPAKFVLHTGDIVDYGNIEAYKHAKAILDELHMPYFIIPGNHDSRDKLRRVFNREHLYLPQNGVINYLIEGHAVNFLMLDTLVPQKVYGFVEKETFDWMQTVLDIDKSKPVIICMHHFPCKVYYQLFNDIALKNAYTFKEFIKTKKQIVAIIAGHYHMAVSTTFTGKNCWISPSVAPVHYFDSAEAANFSAIRMGLPSFSLHTYNKTNGLTCAAITVGVNRAG